MEWHHLVLGPVRIAGADPKGVLVERQQTNDDQIRIVARGFVAEPTGKPPRRGYRLRHGSPPFERSALGRKARLAWPAGATAIGEYADIEVWDERFAIVLDGRVLRVIDAESDRVLKLELPDGILLGPLAEPTASDGYLWLQVFDGLLAIPTAELAELAAGEIQIRIAAHYPLRRREARLGCVFLWYLQNGQAMVEIGDGKGGAKEPKLVIDLPKLDIAKYTPVTLVDELHAGHYAAIEVAGRRIALVELERTTELSVTASSSRAKDPTGVAKPKASALPAKAATGELERLIAAVAAAPDDDAPRAVLADLLIELGDPAGEAIAKLRGGSSSPATLKRALGPLGLYLTKVEHRGGFPYEATVARDAPDEDDHAAELAAACDDVRISTLHTLHSQRGRRAAPGIYARLVAAPKATALRRVDVSSQAVIEALIAANRDQLEYLEHVDFAVEAANGQLATPTFDRVTTVHTVVGLAHLNPLINRLTKDRSKFFERAPRRLVLDETVNRNLDLVRAICAVWSQLPLAAVTIAGGVTIERDGPITGSDRQLVACAKVNLKK